jgi:hypothetical protein
MLLHRLSQDLFRKLNTVPVVPVRKTADVGRRVTLTYMGGNCAYEMADVEAVGGPDGRERENGPRQANNEGIICDRWPGSHLEHANA